MSTTKLYQNDRYLKECDAVITSVDNCSHPVENNVQKVDITLDKTIFFPEGGGQSCDTGWIDSFQVIDVQEGNSEEVIHTLLWTTDKPMPAAGDNVHCMIDWNRRFDNMQRHCGEHILSGIFYDLYGGVNRGFHMGKDYMTIDISIEEPPGGYGICTRVSGADTSVSPSQKAASDSTPAESETEHSDAADPAGPISRAPGYAPEIKEITYEMALAAELEANKVIWSDAPVTVMHFDSREEAAGLPLRKALAFDEDISIVCVGSPDKASDCVACCGTHPSTAGQVGLIKIYKVEKNKGMFRIYFEAGQRALKDYRMKHSMLTELSDSYSSSVEDFPDKLRAQEDRLQETKDQLSHMRKLLISKECCDLEKALTASGETALIYSPEGFSIDDLNEIARKYTVGGKNKKSRKKSAASSDEQSSAPDPSSILEGRLLMLFSEKDLSFILISDGGYDCGSLVKELASSCGGKGGGSKTSARAMFSSPEGAAQFAELVKGQLQ